jgi:hypothetical protein
MLTKASSLDRLQKSEKLLFSTATFSQSSWLCQIKGNKRDSHCITVFSGRPERLAQG